MFAKFDKYHLFSSRINIQIDASRYIPSIYVTATDQQLSKSFGLYQCYRLLRLKTKASNLLEIECMRQASPIKRPLI